MRRVISALLLAFIMVLSVAAQDRTTLETKSFTVNGVTFDMVFVKGGSFYMGVHKDSIPPSDNRNPRHKVTLSSYYIGKYEVTQSLWVAVMGTNPSVFVGDSLPVDGISRSDCLQFIEKLNCLTKLKFSLPTEAQWEYAARGGNKSRNYIFSGSNVAGDVAWFQENSERRTHPVGTKKPNELGIYDMTGNVYEWCSDYYGSYTSEHAINPTGAAKSDSYILRGASYSNYNHECSLTVRQYYPDVIYFDGGMRLVLLP